MREPAAISAIVLAAGRSSRMGHFKLLAEVAGEPMVRRTVAAVLASRVVEVIVVTGNEAEAVQGALAGMPVRFVHNPDFARGLSTSLGAGLAAVKGDAEGVLVVLADMPRVPSELIDKLIAAFRPGHVVVPAFEGRIGNPVLWPREAFAAMRGLTGDAGARKLLALFPDRTITVAACGDGIFADVDTPEALAEVRAQLVADQRHSPRPEDREAGEA